MKYLITVTLLVALKAANFGQNTTNFANTAARRVQN